MKKIITLLMVICIINIFTIILLVNIINDKNKLIINLQNKIKSLTNEISDLKIKENQAVRAFYSCNDVLIEEGLVNE